MIASLDLSFILIGDFLYTSGELSNLKMTPERASKGTLKACPLRIGPGIAPLEWALE